MTAPTAPTKSGYTFDGWTVNDGDTTTITFAYSPGGTSPITLYAKWSASGGGTPASHTVTFNNNSGSGTMTALVASSTTNLTANTFTRSGYTFTGWATTSNGSVVYADQASYAFSADISLYAQWSAVTSGSNVTPTVVTPTVVTPAVETPTVVTPAVETPTVVTPVAVDRTKLLELVPVVHEQTPAAGELIVTQAGKQVSVIIQEAKLTNTAQALDSIEIIAPDWKLALAGVDSTGTAIPLNSKGQIVVGADNMASTSGQGFLPNSLVKVYIFSTPQLLGTLNTDALGKFIGSLPLPLGISSGDHTLQVNGFAPNGEIRSASVGILLEDAKIVKPVRNSFSMNITFALNSASVSAAESKRIRYFVNTISALAGKLTINWSISGYTQPTLHNPNPLQLSIRRAQSALAAAKRFGAKGTFKTSGKGNASINKPTSRFARIVVSF